MMAANASLLSVLQSATRASVRSIGSVSLSTAERISNGMAGSGTSSPSARLRKSGGRTLGSFSASARSWRVASLRFARFLASSLPSHVASALTSVDIVLKIASAIFGDSLQGSGW